MTKLLSNHLIKVISILILFASTASRIESENHSHFRGSELSKITHVDTIVFTPEQLKLPGKRGACFTLNPPVENYQKSSREDNLPRLAKLQPYWNYSWGSEWVPQQKEFISSEFIPMIWGDGNVKETLRETIMPLIQDGTVKRVLGFNEPCSPGQANMTYQRAIELWPAFMKLGVPLVSPAPVHPTGDWLRGFMEEVDQRGYRVDYIGVHWYGGTDANGFKNQMRRIHEMYGNRPLLITEFSPADWQAHSLNDPAVNRHTPAEVLVFAKEVLPWMEKQEWIAGYAWYSFGYHRAAGWSSGLFFPDGALTALGRYYASVTTENPLGDQSIEPDDAADFLSKVQKAWKQRESGD